VCRDIKPHNVLLEERPTGGDGGGCGGGGGMLARLTDFGSACVRPPAEAAGAGGPAGAVADGAFAERCVVSANHTQVCDSAYKYLLRIQVHVCSDMHVSVWDACARV
jgi:serine/threonine protein kinase